MGNKGSRSLLPSRFRSNHFQYNQTNNYGHNNLNKVLTTASSLDIKHESYNNNRLLASAYDNGSIHIYGSQNISVLLQDDMPPLSDNIEDNTILYIQFLPNGRLLSIAPLIIKIWSLESLNVIYSLDFEANKRISCAYLSPEYGYRFVFLGINNISSEDNYTYITMFDCEKHKLSAFNITLNNALPKELINNQSNQSASFFSRLTGDNNTNTSAPTPNMKNDLVFITCIAQMPFDYSQLLIGYSNDIVSTYHIGGQKFHRSYQLPKGNNSSSNNYRGGVSALTWEPNAESFAVGYNDGLVAIWKRKNNVTPSALLYVSGSSVVSAATGTSNPSILLPRTPVRKLIWSELSSNNNIKSSGIYVCGGSVKDHETGGIVLISGNSFEQRRIMSPGQISDEIIDFQLFQFQAKATNTTTTAPTSAAAAYSAALTSAPTTSNSSFPVSNAASTNSVVSLVALTSSGVLDIYYPYISFGSIGLSDFDANPITSVKTIAGNNNQDHFVLANLINELKLSTLNPAQTTRRKLQSQGLWPLIGGLDNDSVTSLDELVNSISSLQSKGSTSKSKQFTDPAPQLLFTAHNDGEIRVWNTSAAYNIQLLTTIQLKKLIEFGENNSIQLKNAIISNKTNATTATNNNNNNNHNNTSPVKPQLNKQSSAGSSTAKPQITESASISAAFATSPSKPSSSLGFSFAGLNTAATSTPAAISAASVTAGTSSLSNSGILTATSPRVGTATVPSAISAVAANHPVATTINSNSLAIITAATVKQDNIAANTKSEGQQTSPSSAVSSSDNNSVVGEAATLSNPTTTVSSTGNINSTDLPKQEQSTTSTVVAATTANIQPSAAPSAASSNPTTTPVLSKTASTDSNGALATQPATIPSTSGNSSLSPLLVISKIQFCIKSRILVIGLQSGDILVFQYKPKELPTPTSASGEASPTTTEIKSAICTPLQQNQQQQPAPIISPAQALAQSSSPATGPISVNEPVSPTKQTIPTSPNSPPPTQPASFAFEPLYKLSCRCSIRLIEIEQSINRLIVSDEKGNILLVELQSGKVIKQLSSGLAISCIHISSKLLLQVKSSQQLPYIYISKIDGNLSIFSALNGAHILDIPKQLEDNEDRNASPALLLLQTIQCKDQVNAFAPLFEETIAEAKSNTLANSTNKAGTLNAKPKEEEYDSQHYCVAVSPRAIKLLAVNSKKLIVLNMVIPPKPILSAIIIQSPHCISSTDQDEYDDLVESNMSENENNEENETNTAEQNINANKAKPSDSSMKPEEIELKPARELALITVDNTGALSIYTLMDLKLLHQTVLTPTPIINNTIQQQSTLSITVDGRLFWLANNSKLLSQAQLFGYKYYKFNDAPCKIWDEFSVNNTNNSTNTNTVSNNSSSTNYSPPKSTSWGFTSLFTTVASHISLFDQPIQDKRIEETEQKLNELHAQANAKQVREELFAKQSKPNDSNNDKKANESSNTTVNKSTTSAANATASTMNQNKKLAQENLNKLKQFEQRAEEMEQSAISFADAAKKLKEKAMKESSWW